MLQTALFKSPREPPALCPLSPFTQQAGHLGGGEAAGSGRRGAADVGGAGASSPWHQGRELPLHGQERAGAAPEGCRCGRGTRAPDGRPGSGQGQNCLRRAVRVPGRACVLGTVACVVFEAGTRQSGGVGGDPGGGILSLPSCTPLTLPDSASSFSSPFPSLLLLSTARLSPPQDALDVLLRGMVWLPGSFCWVRPGHRRPPDKPLVKWPLRRGESVRFLNLPRQQFLARFCQGTSFSLKLKAR